MSDVCLILEGTYPYVTGGVSSCVYQLIRETPEVNYFIVYIGATKDSQSEYKYPIPDNVQLIKTITIFDFDIDTPAQKLGINFDWTLLEKFHQVRDKPSFAGFDQIMKDLFFPDTRLCDPSLLFSSKEAWSVLEKLYKRHDNAPPFIDYFYTWRFTHFPLFKILGAEIPQTSLYHSLSTGYAGLLGALAKTRFGSPYILTEHGIYTNERKIEISLADWVYNTDQSIEAKREPSFFKDWWIKLFSFMSKFSYERADIITTLYNGNREKQLELGAKKEKIRIVPNGINYEVFSSLKSVGKIEKKNGVVIVALVGRVVPIKDIKTFIKAIGLVWLQSKNFKTLIMGPTDEDEEYFKDCQGLVKIFGLEKCIEFKGKVNVKEYYPDIDLMVLSSISEGQPLVILEGFCLGIPCVATDVGACSELIYGMTDKDKLIGPAGTVVSFGKPSLLADALLELISDDEKRKQYGNNGKKRIEQFYREEKTIESYLEIYDELSEGH